MARKQTLQADVKLDDRGRAIEPDAADFGENVLIVEPPQENVSKWASQRISGTPMKRRTKSSFQCFRVSGPNTEH